MRATEEATCRKHVFGGRFMTLQPLNAARIFNVARGTRSQR